MDRFDAMRVFTRVVERRSFTLAAEDLGLPRSTVTDAVKQLEARVGVRLLERATRQVRPTLDGEAYYRRCLSLIADLEDAEAAFGGAKPKGLLRVDVHGTLARHFVMPRLPDFLADGTVREVTLRTTVSVNGAESRVAAARLGLGLIQVPRYHIDDDLKRGTLVAVLPDCPPSPTPVSLLYPRNRQLSPRVRVFIDWLMRAFDAPRGS